MYSDMNDVVPADLLGAGGDVHPRGEGCSRVARVVPNQTHKSIPSKLK